LTKLKNFINGEAVIEKLPGIIIENNLNKVKEYLRIYLSPFSKLCGLEFLNKKKEYL